MSHPSFIFSKPERSLLRVSFHGFWTMDTVRAFAAQCSEAMKQMSSICSGPEGFRYLVDRRDEPVQSLEVVKALQEILATEGLRCRKAVLSNSALQRRQIARVNAGEDIAVFELESEALGSGPIKWLAGEAAS